MAKIIFNNEEFQFGGYNRNIYFSNDTITSTGYVNMITGENVANRLQELMNDPITSIAIKKDDDTIIYSLDNLQAQITNIDESFNGNDQVVTNLGLKFDSLE